MFGFFGAFDSLADPLRISRNRLNSNRTGENEWERQEQRTPNFFGDIGLYTKRFGDFHWKPVAMRFGTGVEKRRENLAANNAVTALNTEGENKTAQTLGLTLHHRLASARGNVFTGQLGFFQTDEDKLDKWKQSFSLVNGNFVPNVRGLEPEYKIDKTWQGQAAMAIPFRLGVWNEFKFGGSFRTRDRFRDKTRLEVNNAGVVRTLLDNKDTYNVAENYQAYFAQNRFRLTERLSFQPGVRIERVDLNTRTPLRAATPRTFIDVNPSLALLYRVKSNWTLRAAASRGVNRPKFDELSPFENESTTKITIGNPGLEPSRAWSYDVGTEYATRGVTLAFNGFRKTVRGVIEEVDTRVIRDGRPIFQVLNVGNGWLRGIELEQRLRMPAGLPAWMRAFSFWGNQTFLSSELKDFSGLRRRFKEQPYWITNLGTDYVEERTGTSVSLMGNFLSRRDDFKVNGDVGRVGAGASIDMAVYQRLRGRWRMFLEANNMTNRLRIQNEDFVNGTTTRRLEGFGRLWLTGVQFAY
jgi:outer membrane receptor protein involved in Fe transport